LTTTNPIIVALDVPNRAEAMRLVRALDGAAGCYKVGMELYAAEGPALARELLAEGNRVFLDLKFYDIPETVKRATAVVAAMGVDLLTVHGSGSVMRAASEGRSGSALKLLAVTVLTSFDADDMADLGYSSPIPDLVELRVRKARQAGIDGIVCSPLEVSRVRAVAGPDALLVTPGVRSAGAEQGDQKRVATPREAIGHGANLLVIGRQITRSPDPRGAALRIVDEIQ
jgi:orotidine-5'-phosphate decarboxylase